MKNYQKKISEIRKELIPHLPADFYVKNRYRLCYLFSAILYALFHFILTNKLIYSDHPNWILYSISAFVLANLGTFFFFTAHEAMHFSICRSVWMNRLIAFISSVPSLITPEVWLKWHRHHHTYTGMKQDMDRMRHPQFDDFSRKSIRIFDRLMNFNYKNIYSYLISFNVICFSHLGMFVEGILRKSEFKINRNKAIFEVIVGSAIFFSPLVLFPFKLCFLGFYLPIIFSNLICGLYIVTNHMDNGLNDKNYPLFNSTSVSIFWGISHMGFGRHVEHHIFPEVTHDKLKAITFLLRKNYPNEFKERSLFQALHSIWKKDKKNLIVLSPSE